MTEFKLYGSVIDLAAVLELSTRQVERLLADDVFSREENGDIYLPKAIRNYYARKFDNSEHLDYTEVKTHHEYIKSQLSALELAKRRNEVHDARDVELIMTDNIVNARTLLLGIPTKVVPQLEGCTREEMYAILTREIKAALCELSEYKPTMFDVEAAVPNDNNSQENK